MMEFLAKVVAELIFRALVVLIGWSGTQPFVQDVVNALLERWERSGIVAATWSALDALPRALQSRATWIGKRAAAGAVENNDLAAPLLAFIGGMYFAFDFAFWLAQLLAPAAMHEQGWPLQAFTIGIATCIIIAAAFILRRLSRAIVELESVGFDWFIFVIASTVVFQAAFRAYLSGSWYSVSQLMMVIALRAALALAIGWIDAKREEANEDRKRRGALPSYFR